MPPAPSILPPNSTALELATDLLAALRLDGIGSPLRSLWSAQDCPADLLPWLAWALSIDQWDPAWPERTRRARIAQAIAVQRRKGTLDSVSQVIGTFGGNITLREWWQTTPPGPPHTFDVTLSLPAESEGTAPSSALVDAVVAEIEATKPLRSHFTFTLAQRARAGIGLRAVSRPVTYARLAVASPVDPAPAPAFSLTLRGMPLSLGGDVLTFGA
ncbi:phage tail protein I [Novosphingobium sp.]|uniref:phage tail protein I n=1 Tax=Novosphingobium sp. TaxID=1874826 RepID=UPI00263138F3|nr:phage tail protein I [Novosphingobium sp.]